jgi:glycosyltransferase involved in cell wall biosynthesis
VRESIRSSRIYQRARPTLKKIYGRISTFWAKVRRVLARLISPVWPTYMSDYLSTWWRMASGRYGLEMRVLLEQQLAGRSAQWQVGKPRIFFGLYHAPEQVFFARMFREMGLICRYETLDLNPGFPMVDAHHSLWSPDIYREHALLNDDVLIRTNAPVSNGMNLEQLLSFFLERWDKYDVFHFSWFMSFLPDNIDVEYLRRSGRLVYFQMHGCFIQYHNRVLVEFTERGESVAEMCMHCKKMGWREAYFERWHRGIAHANRVFVTNPCLTHCSPEFEYLPSPLEASLAALPRSMPKAKGPDDPLVVLHAPSNPYIKGTPHVIRAVDELQKEGLNVKLQIIQKMSRAEAMKQYGDCDIFVEQLHLGSYGNAALEAMAHGVPVISSNHPSHAHLAPGCPIVHADPVTLTARLRELVVDPNLRAELGEKCYTWVREFHSISKISAHLLRIYEEDSGLRPVRPRNTLQNREPGYGN